MCGQVDKKEKPSASPRSRREPAGESTLEWGRFRELSCGAGDFQGSELGVDVTPVC